MKVAELNYELPNELLAREPKELSDDPRVRLLVMDRKENKVEHRFFEDCIDYFQKGDVLVLNNSKTIKADLIGWYEGSKRVNIQLACELGKKRWIVYSFSTGMKKDKEIVFGEEQLHCKLIKLVEGECIWEVEFRENNLYEILEEIGRPIMSPYVKKEYDIKYYQNEYATVQGSTELPAAGKHFNQDIIKKLMDKGVTVTYITLHTGLSSIGVSEEFFENHKMHNEQIELKKETADIVNAAHIRGNKVFAVGTTVVRTLESCAKEGKVYPYKGYTDLYIYPGYTYQICDALFTNFHGPKTSRIALAAAFTGKDLLLQGYKEAIENKYMFYEFGDTTLTV